MRRELEIRCVSTGTLRTEGPIGTRCELREVFLELDGAPARLQILESHDHDQHTRDVAVELDGICVRSRTGHDVKPPPSTAHMPLDWLIAMAEWMRKGERRTVPLWVRSMDPAALLSATPVRACGARRQDPLSDAGTAATLRFPPTRLRLLAAGR